MRLLSSPELLLLLLLLGEAGVKVTRRLSAVYCHHRQLAHLAQVSKLVLYCSQIYTGIKPQLASNTVILLETKMLLVSVALV